MLDVDRGHAGHYSNWRISRRRDRLAPEGLALRWYCPCTRHKPGAWVGAAYRLEDRQSKSHSKKSNHEERK